MPGTRDRTDDEITRRDFVTNAAKGFLGLGTIPMLARLSLAEGLGSGTTLRLNAATARNVIYLYMSGGMSHVDTFDTKPGADTQGPVESIKTNVPGILISEYFPHTARHMDKMAVINSMQTTQGAHAQGRYFMHTSYEMRGTIRHPSLGAWLHQLAGPLNPSLPGHIAIGNDVYGASGGFFESKTFPLPIGDPASGLQNSQLSENVEESTFHARLSRLESMNAAFVAKHNQKQVRTYSAMYDEAVKLMRSNDLRAFDLKEEPEELRQAYGMDRFGQGCVLARRLIEHGVRFVEVMNGGWDTHDQNFEALEEKCPAVDRPLAALLADLDCRGLLEETLVVVATEFGRSPVIVTDRMGRDHYPQAFTCLLAGGGVHGGIKYGRTNDTGAEVIDSPVSVPDFNATIAYALGLPLEHIVHSPSGRPFTVAHKGNPVKSLFT